jgi:ammonium transporter, Amt family
MPPAFDAGNTAYVLVGAALVLLMTPGLAFFYGGMVRVKSVLNMLMMSFITIAIVTVLWVLYGFTLSFGKDAGGYGLIGGLKNLFMHGIGMNSSLWPAVGVPVIAFACFQLMFAIITPALISGAIADRAKFGGWVLFVVLWATLVYFPVAHWVFAPDGWVISKLHGLDFAGGTAVHANAGAAGLALAFVLGKRIGFQKEPMRPHNVPFVLLGASLLWFGWFGFNSGSALASNGLGAMAFLNTQVATASATLGWLIVEKIRDGHATTVGAASGAVAGLVAITPACGSVSPLGAIIVGGLAGAICALAVSLKFKLGFDDSLDVVAVHLIGGVVGTLLIGFLATKEMTTATAIGGEPGLLYGGGFTQLGRQAVAVVVVVVYSFVMSFILGKIVDKTIGFRVSEEDEVTGVDLTTHAETAYELGPITVAGHPRAGVAAGKAGTTSSQEKVEA